jgi:nucleotide-binding universal stress UspA family protein
MTFMVAFDGSELAGAALDRASDLADAVGAETVAVSVVPQDSLYARERGWVEHERDYDPRAVAERLRDRAREIAPEVSFRLETLGDDVVHRDIAKQLRRTAYEMDADVVVVGSDNAGRVLSPVSSVGSTVASGSYDVFVVRSTD